MSEKLSPENGYVPLPAIIQENKAMLDGAKKYGAFNWREDPKAKPITEHLGAALGHIASFISGEDNASDSGINHLAHARARLGIVLDILDCRKELDDRKTLGIGLYSEWFDGLLDRVNDCAEELRRIGNV